MAFFDKGREGFATGSTSGFDWLTNRLLVYLIDMDFAGPAAGAWQFANSSSGVTFSTTTVTVTTRANHGLSVGDPIEVFAVGGLTNVDGIWTVATTPTTTTATFVVNSTPTGTYTNGSGYLINLGPSIQFSSNMGIGTPSSTNPNVASLAMATSGRTATGGVLDGPDMTFTSVTTATGTPLEALVIAKGSNTDVSTLDTTYSSQRLILCQTKATSGLTGFPLTPNSGNINVTWSTSGIAKL